MTNTIRAGMMLSLLVVFTAYRPSEQGRLRDARERAATHAIVARSPVVQSLASSQVSGSLIYDKPTDLSYSSLRATRPDLDSAKNVHGRPSATEQGSRNTNRGAERTPQHQREP